MNTLEHNKIRALLTIPALVAITIATILLTTSPAVAGPICTCRHAGASYELNSCVCMATPNGARVACCGLVLNNTSWKISGDQCPLASVAPHKASPRSLRAIDTPIPQSPWHAANVIR